MPSISSGAYCFSHERNSQFSSSCSRERPWILDRSVSISGLLSSVLFGGFIPASLGMVPLLPTSTREIVAGLVSSAEPVFQTSVLARTFPITRAGSNGRCNTIWYKAVFKGGVYETRETVWAFGGAETRRVASLEGRADAA